MIRIVLGAAAIAAVMAEPAMAQNCYYDWYGRIVCAPSQYYQQQQQPQYRSVPGRMTRDAGPVIDPSGGCEGGSCVNFGPGYR